MLREHRLRARLSRATFFVTDGNEPMKVTNDNWRRFGRWVAEKRDALAGLIKAEMLTLQAELAPILARKAELETQAAQRASLYQSRRESAEMIRLALARPGHAQWTFEERRAVLEIVGVRVEVNRPNWQIYLLQF